MQGDLAKEYIYRLKSPQKRAYAEQYWRWLVETTVTDNRPEPPQPSGLNPRAVVSVRNNLNHLAGSTRGLI